MRTLVRLGADIVGSVYELAGNNAKAYDCWLWGFRKYWGLK